MASEALARYWLGDWQAVLAARGPFEAAARKIFLPLGITESFLGTILSRGEWPYDAATLARTGDFKGAHALIDKTPLDCYACLRNRGEIDAAEKDWGGAEYWFARATAFAPSLPLAYVAWGRMRFAKGDADGAIAKFEAANARGRATPMRSKGGARR